MEEQADFANRLPRGQTYVRNGSVAHLAIGRGEVSAFVSGSELYTVNVHVKPLTPARWKHIKENCAGKVGSALELLQGKLSTAVMTVLAQPGEGMIPRAGEFSFDCSCPDSASLCKHIAAVFYGVGARLDKKPELLFTLRGVDLKELVSEAGRAVTKVKKPAQAIEADEASLADIFGIDLGGGTPEVTAKKPARAVQTKVKAAAAVVSAGAVVSRTSPKKKPARAVEKPVKAVTAKAPEQELTTAEVRALGYTAAQMKKMLAEGTLERTGFGWYRFVRGSPTTK